MYLTSGLHMCLHQTEESLGKADPTLNRTSPIRAERKLYERS
jgi:hypothetical protein